MRALFGVCLATAFTVIPASAQQGVFQAALPALCAPEAQIAEILGRLNERVTHVAETSTNGTVTIWQREDGNAWTIVFHPGDGMACVVADGANFSRV